MHACASERCYTGIPQFPREDGTGNDKGEQAGGKKTKKILPNLQVHTSNLCKQSSPPALQLNGNVNHNGRMLPIIMM